MSNVIIDVSAHNGIIDWDRVKPNIARAIIRCGYGDNIERQDDKQFKRNMNECIRLGIPKDIYIYSYSDSDAHTDSEIAHVLRLLAPYNDKTIRVILDLEENGTENGAVDRARRFANGIKAEGYEVIIYANENWWNNYLQGLDEFPKWVAKYSSNQPNVKDTWLWQYTSSGQINGIAGRVDCSKVINDYKFEQPAEQPAQSATINPNVDVQYQVGTERGRIYSPVTNYNDFAGVRGERINGFRATVSQGSIKYRAHYLDGTYSDWCVDGQWCGDGRIFDAIEIYYITPDWLKNAIGKYKYAVYRVSPLNRDYYSEQIDTKVDKSKRMDGHAGAFGKSFDRLQLKIV